jgi:N-glycosidase YbiA
MNTIKFYKTNESYGFFSNFSPHPVFIENELWATTEHYFQASKFEDITVRNKIKNIKSPMDAANEGRNRNNRLRLNWEDIKDKIMYNGLFFKFLQHPKLRKELILTGDKVLIEHTENDNYWADGGDGSGENKLGILLMNLRSDIKNISPDPDIVLPPWIPFPSIDQNNLFWRMGLGEDYLAQWSKYYLRLTDNSIYKRNFPENEDWEGIYD